MRNLKLIDVENAMVRISKYVNSTPIITSSWLNQQLGHKLYFKAESFQKIGAFKARGACNTISWLIANKQRPKHIVSNSSGNHAQAVAWAASQFGISATIYMPATASGIKIQATKSYGAEVVLCETRTVADEFVEREAKKEGVYWLPPYNHEQVISGQGTAAYEALKELGEVDAVFAPCGGGGLLSGTLIATRGLTGKASVIGTEPSNANDAAESLKKGSIQRLFTAPNTIADGAMTMSVGELTFRYLKQLDDFYEVSEEQIIYWTQWLNHLLKIRIEPTSAMTMGGVVQWLKKQKSSKKILIILSGGNIDPITELKVWKTDYLKFLPS